MGNPERKTYGCFSLSGSVSLEKVIIKVHCKWKNKQMFHVLLKINQDWFAKHTLQSVFYVIRSTKVRPINKHKKDRFL